MHVPAAPPAPTPDRSAFAQVLAAKLGPGSLTLGQMVDQMVDRMVGQAPGTSSAGAPPVASPMTSPVTSPVTSPGSQAAGDRVIATAARYLGVPYRWGGTDPATGLDCSGFVQRAFADLGVALPRTSAQQAREGVAVASLGDARPGDLVYWRGSPNHVGIYAGDGRMIVAPRSGDVVRFQSLSDRRPPDAIRRIV